LALRVYRCTSDPAKAAKEFTSLHR